MALYSAKARYVYRTDQSVKAARAQDRAKAMNCGRTPKKKAKEATRQGIDLLIHTLRARSTTLNIAHAKQGIVSSLHKKVGKFSKRVDAALPGKHT